MLSDKAVEAIQDSVKTEVIELDGKNYTTRPVFDPRVKEPTAEPLKIHTLTGLVEYIAAQIDGESEVPQAVHVVSPTVVRLIGGLFGDMKQRDVLVEVNFESLIGNQFAFGRFYDSESFNIALQTLFVQSPERDAILKLAGNLVDEDVRTVVDDGVSQKAAIRQGIASVNSVDVPNPVRLRPYRTFREIEQPESPFIFRLQRGDKGVPACALFEGDGGTWKLDAIKAIEDYLTGKVGELPIIA